MAFSITIIGCGLFFVVTGKEFLNSALRKHLPEDCGRSRFEKMAAVPRIINGEEARLGEFPWMAQLGIYPNNSLLRTPSGEDIIFYCGGSILNRYFVLSAAHCEDYADVIRLGENYMKTKIDCDKFGDCAPPHQDIKPKRFIFQDFCFVSKVNDLAIIELETPAQLNDYVQPICMPLASWTNQMFLGESFTLAGWGWINVTNTSIDSDNLLYVNVPSISYTECKKIYKGVQNDSQICIGDQVNGKNTCKGDSGGPAMKMIEVNGVKRMYLFGVTSYAMIPCVQESVFTSTIFYTESILKSINKS